MSGILLVVEDDADVCDAIVDTLQALPIKILTAADGQQALQIVRSQPIDAILSDINMPGMSGLELLPKAKAVRPDVPIIMITAYGDADTKRKALESGADALFTKPIDFGMLRNEIDSRVERHA